MTSPSGTRPGLLSTVLRYALARVAVVAVVAGLLLLAGVPLTIAVLVGLIVALPLSMVLFRGLRSRLDAALAEARRRRSDERAALRRRLRGEEPAAPGPGSDQAFAADQHAHREPDRGQG